MLKHIIKPLFISIIILLMSPSYLSAVSHPKQGDKDDKHPIQVQSDSADFDHTTGVAFYRGKVRVTMGTRIILSDTLMIHRTKAGKIDKIKAQGTPAYFEALPDPKKPKIKGSAIIIHYLLEGKQVILHKNAELSQGDNKIKAAEIVYHIDQDLMTSKSSHDEKTTLILENI